MLFGGGFYSFLLDRTVESRQESIGGREGGGIGKGPRDRKQTQVAVSTVVLYIGALTTRLSAPTCKL